MIEEIVLAGLAGAAVAINLSNEHGPGGIFEKIRALTPAGSEWDRFVSCPICLSFWFVALFLWLVQPERTWCQRFTAIWSSYGVALAVIAFFFRK